MTTLRLLLIVTGGTIAGNVSSGELKAHGVAGQGFMDRVAVPSAPQDKANPARYHLGEIDPVLQRMLDGTLNDITRNRAGLNGVVVDACPLGNIDSTDLGPTHWSEIIDVLRGQYDNYDAFIVTHGTNTMGYTCAALSFALENIGKPVVVTGSQVPFGWPGSDALTNLENAIRVATWHHSPGPLMGVVGVFGSHVIAGTRVKKSTEFDYDAFQSFSTASLGRIGREIRWNESNVARHHEYLFPHATDSSTLTITNTFDPRLMSFTEFPGMSKETFRRLISFLADGGELRGVVFRAFGAGDVSTSLHPAFEYLREREIPIVVTTQAPSGYSSLDVNVPGQLLKSRRLAIPAYDMSIESMTAKMMWLLGRNCTYDEICAKMVQNLRGEVEPRDHDLSSTILQ